MAKQRIFGEGRRRVNPLTRPAPAATVATSTTSAASAPAAAAPADDDKPERLSFPVGADGGIALDQVRPATLDKIRRALSTAPARAAIFPSTAPAGARVTPEDIALASLIYDALGSIFASGLRASGYPLDQAEMMRYSATEKAALAEPTARVLNKYASGFAYMDEVVLLALFSTITLGKFSAVRRPATVIPFHAPKSETPPEPGA